MKPTTIILLALIFDLGISSSLTKNCEKPCVDLGEFGCFCPDETKKEVEVYCQPGCILIHPEICFCPNSQSFNGGVEKSNNFTTENDFEISPNGLGKSNLSRGRGCSVECSFDEINFCKKECPTQDSKCLYKCFREECTFGFGCKCSDPQIKSCEKKCKNKKCKKNAFCLESCFNATC